MRKKSQEKYTGLLAATLDMVNNSGFHDAPMSKIAKQAGVSPATIYLYFDNKQDLINKLYLEVKASFSRHAFMGYNEKMHVKKGFEVIWNNIANYKLTNVSESMFLSQCDNTPMIDEKSRDEGLKHLEPLLKLWERGQEEGIVKPVSPYVLYAYTIYPLTFLRAMHQKDISHLSETDRKAAFNCAWDSIRV